MRPPPVYIIGALPIKEKEANHVLLFSNISIEIQG